MRASPAGSLTTTSWLFWLTTLGIFALWSLVTIATQGNLPLDHIDLLAWGPGWQLCYWKHPPLPAWIAHALFIATDHAIWPQFLLGPLMTAIATWVVWRAALDVTTPWRALIAALMVQGCIYYSQGCDVFNHNSVQLPFLAAAMWAGWRATRGSTGAWIAFGFFGACALYGKYSAALPIAAVGLYSLCNSDARANWKTRGPWIALLVGAAVMAPHIIAMNAIDFAPLHTPFGRAQEPEPWWGRIAWPFEFLASCVGVLTGVWLMCFVLFSRVFVKSHDGPVELPGHAHARDAATYWMWVSIAPVVMAMVLSSAFNLRMLGLWGHPWFLFVGLACVLWCDRVILTNPLRAMWIVWVALALGTLVFAGVRNIARPYMTGYIANVKFPGEALATAAQEKWNRSVAAIPGTPPMRIVIGDMFSSGNVAVYAPDHPHALIDADPSHAPWIDLARIEREGAMLVWRGKGGAPAPIAKLLATALPNHPRRFEIETVSLSPRTDANVAPMEFSLAVLLPQPQ